jgi:hypothetical protein
LQIYSNKAGNIIILYCDRNQTILSNDNIFYDDNESEHNPTNEEILFAIEKYISNGGKVKIHDGHYPPVLPFMIGIEELED